MAPGAMAVSHPRCVRSGPAETVVAHQLVAAVSGGTHTPLPLPGRNLAVVADEANAEKCAKGLFQIFVVDVRAPENPVTIATMPVPQDRDYCAAPGTFGPHNLH